MTCDLCKENEASIFLEQFNGISKRKLNLCFECARAYDISDKSKKNNVESLSTLFDIVFNKKKISPDDTVLCPVCGISLSEIKRSKQTGCPECYEIFKNEIKEVLKNIGVKGSYTGTMPKRIKNFRSVLTDRIALQSKLEESIKNEDYEKAAIYRDYLKALEKSPVYGGEDE